MEAAGKAPRCVISVYFPDPLTMDLIVTVVHSLPGSSFRVIVSSSQPWSVLSTPPLCPTGPHAVQAIIGLSALGQGS